MELLESDEFSELLTRLETEYEMVIVDGPPMTLVADTIPLVERASGVIVVGRLNVTTRDSAAHMVEQLERLGAPVLGLVVNSVSTKRGYGYLYSYYRSDGKNVRPSWLTRSRRVVGRMLSRAEAD
jgi:Mrp family chromosome partitioning ATPase